MKRILVLLYCVVAYAIFFATLLYAFGFVNDLIVSRSTHSAARPQFVGALFVDALLLGLFALQHNMMAQPVFKAWLIRIVPEPAERSTYLLFSSLALVVLFWQWQPIGGLIWDLQQPIVRVILYAQFACGWLLVVVTTLLIMHFDLRQIWLYVHGTPYTSLRFATPGPSKLLQNPLYVGWLFALWATPTMTATHLLFAVATTGYMIIAIRFEQRDLVRLHGSAHEAYGQRAPMILEASRVHGRPGPRGRRFLEPSRDEIFVNGLPREVPSQPDRQTARR
jgi:methanethiol S-methyltransferase